MNRYRQSGDDPWNGAIQGLSFLGNAMRTGQQIGETRYQQDERDSENKAFEYISGKLGSTGDMSALDADPILNTRHSTMAMGKFMLNRANTEQSRLVMLKSMAEADDHFYKNTFRPMASAAQEAFKSGDMQAFGKVTSELSALSPFPRIGMTIIRRPPRTASWTKRVVVRAWSRVWTSCCHRAMSAPT